uniref:Uncharacterized protein n=1 Tax=Arundo donax TaxID=35708 RepID=A0A0A8Y751_ARUDO
MVMEVLCAWWWLIRPVGGEISRGKLDVCAAPMEEYEGGSSSLVRRSRND